ncbi:MAG: flagellar hook-length control protein FliK, partial [Candidatus Nitrotoga sp.]
MTNLAITGNNSQLPDNATNTLQSTGPVDTQAPGTLIEPFVTLLERQIGKTACLDKFQKSSPALDAAATDNSADYAAKDARNQDAITANIPTDPVNALTIVLLQLPQEISEAAHRSGTPSTGNRGTSKIDLTALNTTFRIDSSIARPDIARPDIAQPDTAESLPGKIDTPASVSDKPIFPDALNQDAVKRGELATISASPTQPTPGIIQTITMSTMPAVMPNTLPNIRAADALQTIATPLGKDGWSDEFTQKISWMSSQKNQVAELHLNPPDLGPLDVVLKISDNQATAVFMSSHSAVRDAVENALPKLREILADNGITLGNTTVSDQSPQDAERFMRQGFGSGTTAQRDGSGETSRTEKVLAATAQITSVRRHNG